MRICLIDEVERLKDWSDFFVWVPMVITDNDTKRKYWVWLETIRRKRIYALSNGRLIDPFWQYRIKWPTHGEWNI